VVRHFIVSRHGEVFCRPALKCPKSLYGLRG
jgi:hypothetical protein